MEPDFGGYATKAGLRCSDGRVIKPEAFQHMDGKVVPLVWQHGHNTPENVLGHVKLEARPDGVYGYGFFNGTTNGQHAKTAVQHGDIDKLSIYATQIKELNKNVSHGNVREVSLVLSGANPGAKIDYVRIKHGEDPYDITELDDEVIIHTGEKLDLLDEKDADSDVEHAEGDEETVQEIYDSMSEKQKDVVHIMIGAALEESPDPAENTDSDVADSSAEHSDNDSADSSIEQADNEEGIAHEEGSDNMTRNVFENQGGAKTEPEHVISHADIQAIFENGKKLGSFKDAVQGYVLQHGITNVEVLFPDAQAIANTPEFDKRRTEWVRSVLADTRKTPFAKIKTLSADLTQDAARAKGYIKGSYKLEEWFGVTKRTTGPTTVYKKQGLDRDDMLDITDFDVVAWLMAEMRLMLEEEIARAILIGDGRAVEDEDKIKDPLGASDGTGIRSILNDHELFTTTLYVNVGESGATYDKVIDEVMNGMEYYKGTGTPTFYTTVRQLNKFKQAKDGEGRRYYKNNAEVAEALGVDRIVTVEPMQGEVGLIGIVVNLADYNLGTNKGGELTSFDDFDIDYNKYKYLLETRLSGALVKVKTALIIKETAPTSVLVVPLKPTFNSTTGVVTIPTVTGVVYKGNDGTTTLSSGAQTALAAGASTTVYSVPASGYHFASNKDDSWSFTRNPA